MTIKEYLEIKEIEVEILTKDEITTLLIESLTEVIGSLNPTEAATKLDFCLKVLQLDNHNQRIIARHFNSLLEPINKLDAGFFIENFNPAEVAWFHNRYNEVRRIILDPYDTGKIEC